MTGSAECPCFFQRDMVDAFVEPDDLGLSCCVVTARPLVVEDITIFGSDDVHGCAVEDDCRAVAVVEILIGVHIDGSDLQATGMERERAEGDDENKNGETHGDSHCVAFRLLEHSAGEWNGPGLDDKNNPAGFCCHLNFW